jgi:hypothetical protein
MPQMSRKYCLTTPSKKMGFSQKASCKSQGLLKRTSKKYKGKYVVSPKYRKSVRKSRKPKKSVRKSVRKSRKPKKSVRKSRKPKKSVRKSRKSVISGRSLYSDGDGKSRMKAGYGTKEKAEDTIKRLKKFNISYQKQIVNTMYNRAKYHANQTKGMRDAMKVYKKWLDKHKSKSLK